MGVPMTVFTSARAALEATRGTAITPTRILYAESFDLEHNVATIRPETLRGSYEGFTSAAAGPELSRVTMQGRLSYEDFTWHANMFYKALAAASSGAPPNAVWTFLPTNTADDVKSHCLQLGDSAAIATSPGVSLAYGMGEELNLHFEKNADGAVTFSAKYLYAKPLTQITAFTGALSDHTESLISANNTVVKIDTTTIGTTSDSAVTAVDFTLTMGPVPFYALDGTLAAQAVYRPHHRTWKAEITRQYNAATEFTAYVAKTVRKVRVLTTQSTNILQLDMYGVWTDRKYSQVDDIVTEVLTLEPVYDTTSTSSQNVVLTNNLATMT
jgi:hypothetical protein